MPDVTRLRALARIGAEVHHWDDQANINERDAHSGAPHECPHPDCLLVREAVNDGPSNSTDEHLMLNAYGRRCYEAGIASVREAVAPPSQELTFDTFSSVNRQRCESPSGFNHALASWSTSDWFLAVVGELGEAANIAKKLNRVRDGVPGNKESADALRDKLRRELGDAFVYLDLLAQSLGVSIGAAAVEVFNDKSAELGCPISFPLAPRVEPATPEEKPA
jgi:NTP pyrophosphatase (non-canonical NTP hydrolase)